jgi:type II secretion system protein I
MRSARASDGFTLIESLIACAVLATAVLSIGHLASSAVALITDARNRTFATILAVAKLEELRTSPAPAAGADVVDGEGRPPSPATSRRYDRRWSVTPVSPDVQILNVVVTPFPRAAVREVRVTGGWVVRR